MLERICNGIKQIKTTFYNMGFEVVNYSGQHLNIDKIVLTFIEKCLNCCINFNEQAPYLHCLFD